MKKVLKKTDSSRKLSFEFGVKVRVAKANNVKVTKKV